MSFRNEMIILYCYLIRVCEERACLHMHILPTACLFNIQFPYVNVDALRDAADVRLWSNQQSIMSIPLTEANAIHLFPCIFLSFFSLKFCIVCLNASKRHPSSGSCSNPIAIYPSMYIVRGAVVGPFFYQMFIHVKQLHFALLSSSAKGVF